jgi:hypothetical protein
MNENREMAGRDTESGTGAGDAYAQRPPWPPPRYVPEPGEVVRDGATRRIGRVMDLMGPVVCLRPLNGGREWDAWPGDLSPAVQSDALSADVAEANARSRQDRSAREGGPR